MNYLTLYNESFPKSPGEDFCCYINFLKNIYNGNLKELLSNNYYKYFTEL